MICILTDRGHLTESVPAPMGDKGTLAPKFRTIPFGPPFEPHLWRQNGTYWHSSPVWLCPNFITAMSPTPDCHAVSWIDFSLSCHHIGSCFIVTFVKCPWSILYLRHFKLNFFTLHYITLHTLLLYCEMNTHSKLYTYKLYCISCLY